jgi:hypothetical protein
MANLTVKTPHGKYCDDNGDCMLLDSMNACCNFFGELLEYETICGVGDEQGSNCFKKCVKCLNHK